MRVIFVLAALMLAPATAGAQQNGSWKVICAGKVCTASAVGRGAAPIAIHVSLGPVVSIDGASFDARGVVIFAFNGMQTTFFPVSGFLRDGGRRISVGPNEISNEIVRQAREAKTMTVLLPLSGGDRKVDFDLSGFSSAAAKATGR